MQMNPLVNPKKKKKKSQSIEIKDKSRNKILRAYLFQKVVYLLFISFILYSNSKFKYRKNQLFSHLVVFGKLFRIHNLGIDYIILEFGHYFILFF